MSYKNKINGLLIAISVVAIAAPTAHAAVAPDKAAELKSTLTPLGAEKAGNADGSIPSWEGGYTTPDPSYKPGGKRRDLFPDDKVMFTITAQNLDKYADKLSDGTKEMLKKYPDTFRLDVYKTRRTASAPQWLYDNTFKNATTAEIVKGTTGPIPSNTVAGIPFPIPSNGVEVMWNHLLRWRGVSVEMDVFQYLTTADGKHVLTTHGNASQEMPYYFKERSADYDGNYQNFLMESVGPPLRAGEKVLGNEFLDTKNTMGYAYLTGQRRVRKLPNACCDTPTPATAGVMTYDELDVFSGRLDRFDWKLIGKKEMYVPYNSNKINTPDNPEDVLKARHLDPGAVRWELHRVWVVEATLANGQRHQMSKSRYYLDEDTWTAVLGDRWDSGNRLAKTIWTLPVVMPDLPGSIAQTSGFYDLNSGAWFVQTLFNGGKAQYKSVDRFRNTQFTQGILTGKGVR